MENTKKSDQYNPFKQDMSLFMNVVTKVVGTCLFNIDGNKIYQMKCWEALADKLGIKTGFSMVKEE